MTDEQTNNGFSPTHSQESNHHQSISPTPPTDEETHVQSNLTITTETNNENNTNGNTKDGETVSCHTSLNSLNVDIKSNPSNPIQTQRKRRKNVPSQKIARVPSNNESIKAEKHAPSITQISTNTSSTNQSTTETTSTPSPSSTTTKGSATKSNATMIFNLIRSFLEEKKSDHNDENLVSTIDCLIDSLQHLRDRIRNFDNSNSDNDNHLTTVDETSPLNLSKPKKCHSTRLPSGNSEDLSPTTTTVSSPSPSTPTLQFPQIPFTSPSMLYPAFSGKNKYISFEFLLSYSN